MSPMFRKKPSRLCGAIPEFTRRTIAQWEYTVAQRAKRRPYVALGLLGAAVIWGGGCGVLLIATSGNVQDHGVAGGVVSSCFWVFLGAIAAGIAYLVGGPPRRPNVPTTVPPNVRFPLL